MILPIILLVDDNKEILNFVDQMLRKEYQVIKLQDPTQVFEILATNAVQLIISDVMMPVMDGFTLCKKIKADKTYRHIPVILLTAKNTLMSRIEGLELGADAYIDKPFSPKHLKVQIKNLLHNRSILKQCLADSPLLHLKEDASNKGDEQFLENLVEKIHANLDNPQLSGDFLADALHISRPTLYRRVKSISNLSVHELINSTRLKKAAALLAQGELRVFEVSYITGFSSPNHFHRVFLRMFAMSPTDFIKKSKH